MRSVRLARDHPFTDRRPDCRIPAGAVVRGLPCTGAQMRRLLLLSLVAACGGPPHAAQPAPQAVAAAPPRAAPPAPPAHVVLQPRGPTEGHGTTVVTPDHVWAVTGDNGLSIIDRANGRAMASLYMLDHVRDVTFLDHGAAVLLVVEEMQPSGDQLGTTQRRIERWDLASGSRQWSTPLPMLPEAAHDQQQDTIVAGPRGAYITSCTSWHPPLRCAITRVDPTTGATTPIETFQPADAPGGSMEHRVESAGQRFTLRRSCSAGACQWFVFDDSGHIPGAFRAACARFAVDDHLRLSGADPAALPMLQQLGVRVEDSDRACLPAAAPGLPWGIPDNETGITGLGRIAMLGDQLVWQSAATHAAYSLDLTAVGLPRAFAFPSATGASGQWHLAAASASSALYAHDLGRYARWTAPSAAPELGRLPREGTITGDDDSALLVWYAQENVLRMALATRPRPDAALAWKTLPVTALYEPSYTITSIDGRRVVTIAGNADHGVEQVDLASGRVRRQLCRTKAEQARCGHAWGLVPSPDGRTAWIVRSGVNGSELASEFTELDLATLTVRRSLPAPLAAFHGPDDYRMGWLEPGTRFWYGFRALEHGLPCVAVVTLDDAPRSETFCTVGNQVTVAADPRGRFFATHRDLDTVDFFTPSGARVLTVGIRADAPFAQTPDGRFACDGAACDALGCAVGDEVRPVTDAACQPLRADGFALLTELAGAR